MSVLIVIVLAVRRLKSIDNRSELLLYNPVIREQLGLCKGIFIKSWGYVRAYLLRFSSSLLLSNFFT